MRQGLDRRSLSDWRFLGKVSTGRERNPVPLTQERQLEEATKRFHDFTGHDGKWVEDYPSPDGKAAVGAKFGKLDLLCVRNSAGDFWIDFRGAGQPGIGASHDGHQLYILGAPGANAKRQLSKLDGRKVSRGVDVGTVIAVAYTTVRDGRREEYIHDFRPKSRPQLIVTSRGLLILAGGAYQFKDSGINDR